MKPTEKELNRIAQLACLKFSDDEKDALQKSMEYFALMADKVNEVDTDGVEPTFHGIQLSNVFREDIVTSNYSIEQLLENATNKRNGCFVVPKVLE
ncbi:MAG: Asp-tRNA(Asn)/Glu-tRNA(Gln) amidotransferase subunit GatC [Clostridiaceae bacterium]|nr:Asp-tRNA(Asn)/Glu-tRNA(Gln) amidotransferase subunit GatC [Clostridiaceae bacterium]